MSVDVTRRFQPGYGTMWLLVVTAIAVAVLPESLVGIRLKTAATLVALWAAGLIGVSKRKHDYREHPFQRKLGVLASNVVVLAAIVATLAGETGVVGRWAGVLSVAVLVIVVVGVLSHGVARGQ